MLILFSSCEKVVYPLPELPDTVSYSLEIQPIFNEKCVDCHGGDLSPNLMPEVSYQELVEGGYVDTADAGNSKLMKKLYGTHDGRATPVQEQLILTWISEGAKNN